MDLQLMKRKHIDDSYKTAAEFVDNFISAHRGYERLDFVFQSSSLAVK
jgi:hypothetical protein